MGQDVKEKKKPIPTKRQRKPLDKRKLMDTDHHNAIRIHLGEEIVMDILSRLSVRSLFRFKCISKFWHTIICDPYFKIKHQSHAMNSEKLLVGQWCIYNMFSFYSFPLSSVQRVKNVEKLAGPSNYEPVIRYKVFSSCNGLVLLSIDEHLLLWNPSTRESIQLPHSERRNMFLTYGFGYDITSDDYKILKYNYPYFEILALKSGFWRKNINRGRNNLLPMYNTPIDPFACIHGAFHWVGFYDTKFFVVSFSISDEVYGKIQLLEPMMKLFNDTVKYGVAVLRGMLGFYYANNPSEETACKLWIMKDYGVEESWIQLYTIQETSLILNRLIYMFDDDEVLFSYRRNGYTDYRFRTSKGPLGLWPECYALRQGIGPLGLWPERDALRQGIEPHGLWPERDAFRQGITYTESMISPKLLI